MFGIDPSRLNPQALMKLSQLVQGLGPEKMHQIQKLMHNMMAGFDVRKELEEFETTLPPEFRAKLMQILAESGMNPADLMAGSMSSLRPPLSGTLAETEVQADVPMDERQARLTLLRAVAAGQVSPEEAERLLR